MLLAVLLERTDIDKAPPLIVVVPLYELLGLVRQSPGPVLTRFPLPLIA